MRICTIASGSSGNCYYIGTETTNILIDAGISGKRVREGLEEKVGICGNELDAILVTHEHTDHTQGVGVLARKFKTPLYASQGTWEGIGNKIGKVDTDLYNTLDSADSLEIGDINIECFPTSHDANEPVGFLIENENKRIGIATDSGMITTRVASTLRNTNFLILEANHDEDMLIKGSYPAYLKKRILSDTGHLSNTAAGQVLMDVAGPKTKGIMLAHLSQENNRPSVALKTIKDILEENKIDCTYDLDVAPRSQAGNCIKI